MALPRRTDRHRLALPRLRGHEWLLLLLLQIRLLRLLLVLVWLLLLLLLLHLLSLPLLEERVQLLLLLLRGRLLGGPQGHGRSCLSLVRRRLDGPSHRTRA